MLYDVAPREIQIPVVALQGISDWFGHFIDMRSWQMTGTVTRSSCEGLGCLSCLLTHRILWSYICRRKHRTYLMQKYRIFANELSTSMITCWPRSLAGAPQFCRNFLVGVLIVWDSFPKGRLLVQNAGLLY